jgi:hypothetical protein
LGAGLQQRGNLATGPTTHNTGMAAMHFAEYLDDDRRLAKGARSQQSGLILPFNHLKLSRT